MRKSLLLLSCLFAFAGMAKAEEIAVPIHTTARIPKGVTHQVTGAGVWQDKNKMVWAIRISKLQELAKANNFGVGIYSNTDNNKATGRFPNKAGWDMQININVGKKTISVSHWLSNGQNIGKPLYIDDYLVELKGDILYVAIRKEPIASIPFSDTPSCRVIGSAIGKQVGRIDHSLNLKKSHGTFEPKLDFVRFGGERQVLDKKAEAVLIPRKDGLTVWNSFGERYQEGEKLPKMIGKSSALEIAGAKGETECVFFAVTGKKPFDKFVVTPSALKSKSGKVIPASLLSAKYIAFAGSRREEYYTDILLPYYEKSRSKNHFAAVQVKIPRNIPAGIYKGTVGLTVNGKKVQGIPLSLEVFDFDMPDRPFFKTAYCIKSGHVRKFFEEKKVGGRLQAKEVRGQFALAKEYRFSPRLPLFGSKRTWKDGKLIFDWSQFDKKAHNFFHKDKFTFFQDATFQLGSHNKYMRKMKNMFGKELTYPSPLYDSFFSQLAKGTYEHYKKLGILDKVAFIFWDEPYSEVYPQIIHTIKLSKKAAPGMEAGVFIAHLEPRLAPYIDVWFTFLGTVAQLRGNPATKNKRAWAYNEVGMGNFRNPASVPRLYYWLAENYRIEGYLYSEINCYHPQKGFKRSGDLYYNNWTNHSWMYPTKEIGKPAASLRMELTRDGLDDYDYMALYKKYTGKDLPAYIKKALPTMDKTGIIDFKVKSNRELQILRNRLAKDIVKAKKGK